MYASIPTLNIHNSAGSDNWLDVRGGRGTDMENLHFHVDKGGS